MTTQFCNLEAWIKSNSPLSMKLCFQNTSLPIQTRSCTSRLLRYLIPTWDMCFQLGLVRHLAERTTLQTMCLTIILTVANWEQTFAQQENLTLISGLSAKHGIMTESTRERKMLNHLEFHLSFLNSEHALTLNLASEKLVRSQMSVIKYSQDGLIGS